MNQQTFLAVPEPTEPLPESLHPAARCREVGPYNLNTAEELALILGHTDLIAAHAILNKFPTLYDLTLATETDLTAIPGIGPKTALRLLASLDLARRITIAEPIQRYQIRAPSDAVGPLRSLLPTTDREHFIVLNLDTRNRIRHGQVLYSGSVNTSLIRIAEVFQYAVAHTCTAIVVGHNHPSGDPDPSPEDVALTRRLVDAGRTLQIEVLDHLVLGFNTYVSLRERGLGFESAS